MTRNDTRVVSRDGWQVRLLQVAMTGLIFTPATAYAQNPFARPQQDEVFMIPPRSVSRLLLEGKVALDESRYSDAYSALYQLLRDPSDDNTGVRVSGAAGQDFLTDTSVSGPRTKTLRKEADELLQLLSPEAAESLELQFGVTAQQQFEDALASRDSKAIASVVRNFPHTQASYKAVGVLAAQAITDGQPILAARHLERLCKSPRARKLYGIDLVLNCALLHQSTGRTKRAAELMQLATGWFPLESITLDGQQIRPDGNVDWNVLLDAAVQDGPERFTLPVENWTTAGGDATRNAVSKLGLPIPTHRWFKRIHSNSIELAGLNRVRQASEQAGRYLMPRFELRIANNTIFTKTTDDVILAIDLESGLSQWEMYRWAAAVQLSGASRLQYAKTEGDLAPEISARVWANPAFGQFSCDDQYLYAVRELQSGQAMGGRAIASNFLVATNIKDSEGSVAWNQGASFENTSRADGAVLAGAFFLGPPLPHGDDLYCLVELRSLVELVVLDRHTGDVRWRQQLCTSGFPSAAQSPLRSAQALSPTIADGVCVCPTGRGAVVAVDLTTRQFSWASVYKRVFSVRGSSNRGALSSNQLNQTGWLDSRIVAGDGYVAFTPSETGQLYAFDLMDGKLVLPGINRQQARYIAGIHNGEIIVVAHRRTIGFSCQRGQTRLGPEFTGDSHLVGRGIWMGDEMLLPLSNRKVARINTASGETLEEVQVDQRLGNLFAYKGQMLAVNESQLTSYFTREALEDDFESESPSFQQLNRRALVELSKGNPLEAVDLIRQGLELAPNNSESKFFMIKAVLSGLEKDYERFRPMAEEFEQLVSEEQRFPFLRRIVEGDIAAKNYRDAISRLLQMLDDRLPETQAPRSDSDNYFRLSDQHQTDCDTWIRANLERVYSMLSETDKSDVDELVRSRLPQMVRTSVYNRRKLLSYFTAIPSAHPAILRISRDLQQLGEFTQAESFLIPLSQLGSPKVSAEASALLAQQCQGEFRSLTPMGRSVHDRIQASQEPTKETADLKALLADLDVQWKTGRLEGGIGSQHYQFGQMIPVSGERFGRPPVRVALHRGLVMLYNANGEVAARLPFSQDLNGEIAAFAKARLHGGLLLIETVTEVVAFDLQRGLELRSDTMLWRMSLLQKTTGGYEPSTVNWAPGLLGSVRGTRELPKGQAAVVGELTPHGLPIQIGNRYMMIDPWTGKSLWTRTDVSKKARFACDGNKLAVALPDGTTKILDARDGLLLDEIEGATDHEPWLSKGGYFIDHEMRFDGTGGLLEQPLDIFIWNPFTGEEVFRVKLCVGSRAEVTEDRYLAIVEPNGKMHLIDLEKLGEEPNSFHKELRVNTPRLLDTIGVERFGNRLIVMTNSSDRSLPIRNVAIYRPTDPPDAKVPVHGFVYGIDLVAGELLWQQPGEMYNMEFPQVQPRNMPFAVTYFHNVNSDTINLALVDLRTGTLGFAAKMKATTQQDAALAFACTSHPTEDAISVDIGIRNFRFTATDKPTAPQPVFLFRAK